MVDHPIQGLMATAMQSIKGMVDVNTVVGDAVHTQDGTMVIPVSSVSFGFAAGGSEFGRADGRHAPDDGAGLPFGGGSGAGVSVRPVGFLVVPRQGHIRLLPVDERSTVEHLVEAAPEVLDRIQRMFGKGQGADGPAPGPDAATEPGRSAAGGSGSS